MRGIHLRNLEVGDYAPIISVVNDWWGGREVVALLPRLFFSHFGCTSYAAEYDNAVVGFLVGFRSQCLPEEAYIHFVGVHPDHRRRGVGRLLYQRFFADAAGAGCKLVRSVTSPSNKTSIAYHEGMGFVLEPSEKSVDGVPVVENYDGRGGDRVRFCKVLGS